MKNKYKVIQREDVTIVCDNEACDWEVPCVSNDSETLVNWIDEPCIQCGSSLLTIEDFNHHLKMEKFIRFINAIFFPFLWLRGGKKNKGKMVTYHYHNGKRTIN